MRTKKKFALVLPTFREAENLLPLLNQVREALDRTPYPYEILVVDDDSRDGTEGLVNEIAAQDQRVRLLVRKGERGLSGAVLHGWQHADAGILGVMDADLQHPPELLPKLLDAVERGYDLAIGSRYANGGRLGGWNPLRRMVSAVAVLVALPLQRQGVRVKDPMSGFFVVRRACLDRVVFQPTGFKLLLEILVRGNVRSVREVPFAFGRRWAGSSKATFKVACQYLQLVLKLYTTKRQPAGAIEGVAGD